MPFNFATGEYDDEPKQQPKTAAQGTSGESFDFATGTFGGGQVPSVSPAVTKAVESIPGTDTKTKKEGLLGSTMLAIADGLFSNSVNFISGIASMPYKNYAKRMIEQNQVEGINVTPKNKAAAGIGYNKEGIAYIPKYAEDFNNFGEWLKKKGEKSSEILQEGSSFEQDAIGTQILKGIGGIVPFAAASYLGGNPGLAVGVVGNASMNADDVYDENKAQGKTEEEALKKYQSTFNASLLVNSIFTMFGSMSKLAGNKSIFKKPIVEFLKDSIGEIMEENSEQVIQNLNTGKKWSYGLGQTTAVTAPIAIVMAAFGIGVETDNISAEARKKTEEIVQNMANSGMTKQQAVSVLSGINGKTERENKVFISNAIAENDKIQKELDQNSLKDIEEITPESIQEIADQITQFQHGKLEVAPIEEDVAFKKKDSEYSTVYHGTSKESAASIQKEGFKKMPVSTGVSAFGDGTYLTTSRADAKGYGDVVKAYIPNNLKLKTVSDADAYKINTQELINQGYDGVKLINGNSKNITIFDASKIKTDKAEQKESSTDPLYEFNNFKTIEDPDIARGTVKEAIRDIGGIKNVKRDMVNISDISTTEDVNMRSERAQKVRNEIQGGIITPIILNENMEVVDGHHRLNVYKEIGMKEIPVIVPKRNISDFTDEQTINIDTMPVFHGTNESFENYDASKQKSGRYTGVYVTSDKGFASNYGSKIKKNKIAGKFFDMSTSLKEDRVLSKFNNNEKELQKALEDSGYDGIKIGFNEYVVFPKGVQNKDALFKKQSENKNLISQAEAVAQLKDFLNRLKLDVPVQFVESIITPDNERAFGAFFDGTITFEKFITDKTVLHEVGHVVFRNLEKISLFDGISRPELYREGFEKYADRLAKDMASWEKNLGHEPTAREKNQQKKYLTEEYIMEDLETFSRELDKKNKTLTGKIQQFLSKVYNGLKSLFGKQEAIRDFYNKIIEGKAITQTEITNGGIIDQYLNNNSLDFTQAAFKRKQDISQDEMEAEYSLALEAEKENAVDEEYQNARTIADKYGRIPETMAKLNELTNDEVLDVLPYLPMNLQYKMAGIDPASIDIDETTQIADEFLDGERKMSIPTTMRGEAINILGERLFRKIFRKNSNIGADVVSIEMGIDTEEDVFQFIADRYERRIQIREQVRKEAKAEREATRNIKDKKKREAMIRKAIDNAVKEAVGNIPTQRTTEGGQTSKVIKERMMPTSRKISVSEKKILTDKLKNQAKGSRLGEKAGIKIGRTVQEMIDENTIQELKRKGYLDNLREVITRRSLINQTLDAIRKNIPTEERFKYMTALADIGRKYDRQVQKKIDGEVVTDSKGDPIMVSAYSQLMEDIYARKTELDILAGESKGKARSRSTIAFLKKLYDLQPALVSDAKETLAIEGPISKMNQDQLDRLLEEIKNRIDYIKRNNLFPRIPNKIGRTQREAIAEEAIKQKKNIKENAVRVAKNTADSVGDALSGTFNTVSKILKDADPALAERLRTSEFDTREYIKTEYLPKEAAFSDMMEKLRNKSEEKALLVELSLFDSDVEMAKEVLAEEGISSKPIDDMRSVLDDIYNRLKSVGIDVGYLENMFPRTVRSSAKKEIDRKYSDEIKRMNDEMRAKNGRDLTTEEKATIYTKYYRGFGEGNRIMLGAGRFDKSRTIPQIDSPEVANYYEGVIPSLQSYVSQAIQLYEARKFFGKYNPNLKVEDADFTLSIGYLAEKLQAEGKITPEQNRDIQNALQAYFSVVHMNDVQTFFVNAAYVLGLGRITSAIPQLSETAMYMAINDLSRGKLNSFRKFNITPADINMELLYDNKELNIKKLTEALTLHVKYSDKVSAMIGINGIFRAIKNDASVRNEDGTFGTRELRDKIAWIFGSDKVNEVIGKINEVSFKEPGETLPYELRRIIFSEIGRYRVLSRMDKTPVLIRHPVWGVFKTYTLKMLEATREEGNQEIRNGISEGNKAKIARGVFRKSALILALLMAGVGAQEAKDWIKGKDPKDLSDYAINTLLGMVGLSKYGFDTFDQNGLTGVVQDTAFPAPVAIPLSIFDAIYKDIKGHKGNAKSLNYVPIIGDILYNRL